MSPSTLSHPARLVLVAVLLAAVAALAVVVLTAAAGSGAAHALPLASSGAAPGDLTWG